MKPLYMKTGLAQEGKSVLDSLVVGLLPANAHCLVLGQGGDLGVDVAGTSYALVLAKCG